MPDEIFIDTNILIYAHDADAKDRHKKAKQCISEMWERNVPPWLSVQVLQELFVNLNRKGASVVETQQIVRDYSYWRIVDNTVRLVESGILEMNRWKISFWDGMIIAAAREAEADVIWSEDLSHNQDYDGITVVNPLK